MAASPAEDPAVVVVAFVRGGGSGSQTAGPVVRHALQYFLDHRAEVTAAP
jgi:cell division protein FtsI/penicillin-binding protein 2